jgi:hypothetical protein
MKYNTNMTDLNLLHLIDRKVITYPMKITNKIYHYLTVYFIGPLAQLICNYSDNNSLRISSSFNGEGLKHIITRNNRVFGLNRDFDYKMVEYDLVTGEFIGIVYDISLPAHKPLEVNDNWVIFWNTINPELLLLNRKTNSIRDISRYRKSTKLCLAHKFTLNGDNLTIRYKYSVKTILKIIDLITMSVIRDEVHSKEHSSVYYKNNNLYRIRIPDYSSININVEYSKKSKEKSYIFKLEQTKDNKYKYKYLIAKRTVWIKHISNKIFIPGIIKKYSLGLFDIYLNSTNAIFEFNMGNNKMYIHNIDLDSMNSLNMNDLCLCDEFGKILKLDFEL